MPLREERTYAVAGRPGTPHMPQGAMHMCPNCGGILRQGGIAHCCYRMHEVCRGCAYTGQDARGIIFVVCMQCQEELMGMSRGLGGGEASMILGNLATEYARHAGQVPNEGPTFAERLTQATLDGTEALGTTVGNLAVVGTKATYGFTRGLLQGAFRSLKPGSPGR